MEPTCITFDSGLRLVYLHKPSSVAHLGFFFRAGSRFEKENQTGLAHFLEHCVFKGTKKRSGIQTISRLDEVGGELNAYTAKEELCLHASFPKQHLARAIELLSDISVNPTFSKREVQKEKEIVIDEINSYLDSPSDKIFDDFEEEFFKGHALGNNILGKREDLKKLSQKDLHEFVQSYFSKENLVVSFVGDISIESLERYLNKYMENMPNKGVAIKINPYSGYEPFNIVRKESNYQAHLILGGMAPNYFDEKRTAMAMLMNMLGGPAMNATLNISLRERHVLAYSIEAAYVPYADVGFWQIYVGCESKNINKSIKLIHKELTRLQNKQISEAKLKRLKQQFKGQLALSMDVNSGMMHSLGKSLLAFGQIDTLEDIHRSIDAILAEDIQGLAQNCMKISEISSLIFDLKD
ncbi:MAG: pitrilysin family protein [Crocinitomicaceae bacterium]|nr:pitrilysin family protein [Crocinitomicaceae bacterium]